MKQSPHFHVGYLLLTLTLILGFQLWLEQRLRIEAVSYTRMERAAADGELAELLIDGETLIGTLSQPRPDGTQRIATTLVDPALADRLTGYGVPLQAVPQRSWLRDLLSWILPALLMFALWWWLIQRVGAGKGLGGGMMAIGRSKARIYVETGIPVRFADVAGVDEARAELQEVVNALKAPESHARLGARLPKGILLVGPPGTGKTLLARAVAGEAGVPFFSISGSEFVELFVGVGAARVRDLFAQAQARAPAIIFIDELDALGRARNSYGPHGGNDEKEQTLNQLLAELDGFDPRRGVVLLAATNRPEVLDPALLRAGRFDRQLLVDRPDLAGRLQILRVHLKHIRLVADFDPQPVAQLTPGFSGADLANLVNEAATLATRRNAEAVSLDDFNQAVERIVGGLEKRNRLLNPLERRIVACHELGHALVAIALHGTDPVHKVSIIPRGIGALGYTIQRPIEDRYLMSRGELLQKMAVLLGGRAAERLLFADISTGAADDLVKVTDIARSMVARFGMDADIGDVAWDDRTISFLGDEQPGGRIYSEHTAQRIDTAVQRLIGQAMDSARAIVVEHRAALEHTADILLQRETLQGAELRELLLASTPDSGQCNGSV